MPKVAVRASIAVTMSTDTDKRGGGRKIGLDETVGLEAAAELVVTNGVKSQKAKIKLEVETAGRAAPQASLALSGVAASILLVLRNPMLPL